MQEFTEREVGIIILLASRADPNDYLFAPEIQAAILKARTAIREEPDGTETINARFSFMR